MLECKKTTEGGYVNGVCWIYRDLLLIAGPVIQGDVNNDSLVNLIDILHVVNMILDMSEYDPFSDVNRELTISILDTTSLINIIFVN